MKGNNSCLTAVVLAIIAMLFVSCSPAKQTYYFSWRTLKENQDFQPNGIVTGKTNPEVSSKLFANSCDHDESPGRSVNEPKLSNTVNQEGKIRTRYRLLQKAKAVVIYKKPTLQPMQSDDHRTLLDKCLTYKKTVVYQ